MTTLIEPSDDNTLEVIYIILFALGSLFIIIGLAGGIASIFFLRSSGSKLDEQFKRFCDDRMLHPDCHIATKELSLKGITPWKDYFTREENPVITRSLL